MATERKSGAMASHQGQLGRLAVCAYLAALVTALTGCSASEVVQNLTPATAIDLPQPNYRRVVADNVIPVPIDQNPCAHWRSPMDMMRQG